MEWNFIQMNGCHKWADSIRVYQIKRERKKTIGLNLDAQWTTHIFHSQQYFTIKRMATCSFYYNRRFFPTLICRCRSLIGFGWHYYCCCCCCRRRSQSHTFISQCTSLTIFDDQFNDVLHFNIGAGSVFQNLADFCRSHRFQILQRFNEGV